MHERYEDEPVVGSVREAVESFEGEDAYVRYDDESEDSDEDGSEESGEDESDQSDEDGIEGP